MNIIYSPGNGLECPCCKESNLHQKKIDVFFRKEEDSNDGIFKSIDRNGVDYINGSRNPSSRRDGILINFWCEHCDADPDLAIYQHKGSTYVEWYAMRQKVGA